MKLLALGSPLSLVSSKVFENAGIIFFSTGDFSLVICYCFPLVVVVVVVF